VPIFLYRTITMYRPLLPAVRVPLKFSVVASAWSLQFIPRKGRQEPPRPLKNKPTAP
jgi:hypothetical protein